MKIGYFTERPYQDPDLMAGRIDMADLMMSNGRYDPMLGADLYNRYLDEKIYAEEMGFDMLMLNEHHSTPFCMGGVMNVEASILARETSKAKIVLLGNVIPIWDDPLWLAETLATIDLISRGRLVSGWVRGTGRESGGAQRPSAVQLGAVPGGPRLRAQGVDDAGAVPLGGQALSVPVRQPLDAALSAAPPARVGARGAEQEHRRVVRQEPHPLHHAGHPARTHQAVIRASTTRWPKRPVTKPVRSTAATCSRCTSTRPRRRPTTPAASSSRVRTTSSSRAAGPVRTPSSRTCPA